MANETFCVYFLFRDVKKRSFFAAVTFKKNDPNHKTAKKKIKERFHGKKTNTPRAKIQTCKFSQR